MTATIPSVPDNEPTVHTFNNSEAAYDHSQCDHSIRNGDVLWVPSENAAAILHLAWPIALPGHSVGTFQKSDHPDMTPWHQRGLDALNAHL